MSNNNALHSSALMISASWLAKGLGLISTVILARLLTPSDFGLVAITMLIIYFFNIFTETGFKQYLLSLEQISNEELNTAWTLNVLSKIFLAIGVVIFSKSIAGFFDKPDLYTTIIVVALVPLINSIESPAIYLKKRNFSYGGIFKLTLFSRFLSFFFTLALAYQLKSHWALIGGTILYFSSMSIGSFIIAPYKPSFTLINIKAQWNYSKWIFFRGFVGYARAKADTFILAKAFTSTELGLFTVAKEFSMLIYEQIASPLGEIIMTSVQKAKSSSETVESVIEKYFSLLTSIMLPAAIGLSLLSEYVVINILGEQWHFASPILSVLVYLGLFSGLVIIFQASLSALNHTKTIFKVDLITSVVLVLTLLYFSNKDLVTFALIRSLLGIIVLVGYLIIIKSVTKLSLLRLGTSITPSLFASFCMYIILLQAIELLPDKNISSLIILIFVGIIAYSIIFISFIKLTPYKFKSTIYLENIINNLINKIAH
ncbi:hypothetical protein CMT41_18100 [Colwellia sp. MT41]|uniref:oligosaccharide flippase family protein n=1 Tax=Colwellia sp. MT41 TaxID=58049 RepID=UPI0007177F56|nr:oligosaccharide flippase family protein [Colwellia sp. MT41]ALO36442.1 hypothetical protein CMT41_18100 [Colwellia sp. MT41]